MSTNMQTARNLIRSLINDGVSKDTAGTTVTHDGQQIHISQDATGDLRFDLQGIEKAFVLKSSRLYERPYEPPEQIDHIMTQLNYHGLVEEVDTRFFSNRLECTCGSVRWVKNADLFQVKKCKPCTYRARLDRKKVRRKKIIT